MASKMATLDDLYTDLLKDLYSAEKQLVKALPKIAKNAQSPDLQKAFQEHLKQTEGHVERIERIFSDMDGSPRGKKCVGMEGLIKEAKELIAERPDPDVLDADGHTLGGHLLVELFGHHRPVAELGGVDVLDLHRAFPSWVTGTRATAAAGSRICIKETPTP